MLKAAIVSTVDFVRDLLTPPLFWRSLLPASVYYTGEHFAINTDVTKLIAKGIAWRQREIDFNKLFPDRNGGYILAVVEAPTPELASVARASWPTS
jgi:hypothetical protein